jgi:hypothetical protein
MVDRNANSRRWRLALLPVALALVLGGCAQLGFRPITGDNPYHYRCTGNCQAGA